jgi:putative sterol carrier protein
MVDSDLLNDVKSRLGSSVTIDKSEDFLKLFEIYKQLSQENKELEAEFEDMAMLEMDFLGQIIISDENRKFWFKFKEGKVDYGEGEVENPSLTFTTTMLIFNKIIYGELEISSAHKAGDVKFDGEGEALMDLQSIMAVINEFIKMM